MKRGRNRHEPAVDRKARGRDRRRGSPPQRRALGGTRPAFQVSGTVKDGSGHGWPLYARIEFTSATTEPVVVYSDPVTGRTPPTLAGRDGVRRSPSRRSGPGYAPRGGTVVTAGAPLDADWTLVAAARPLRRAGYAARHLRAAGSLRELRRRRPSAGLDRADRVRRSWVVTDGGGSVRAVRREPYRRLRTLRDRQQRLCLLFRRHVPRDAVDRPVVRRERGDPLGQRLHRDGRSATSPRWTSRSTAARRGSTSGRPRERPVGPGHRDRGHVVCGGARQRAGALSLQWFFGFWWQVDDVAIGPLRLRRPAGRPRRRQRPRREHGPRVERRHGHESRRRHLGDDRRRAGAGRRLLLPLRRRQRLAGVRGLGGVSTPR